MVVQVLQPDLHILCARRSHRLLERDGVTTKHLAVDVHRLLAVLALDPRCALRQPRREGLLPQIERLEHVRVGRVDQDLRHKRSCTLYKPRCCTPYNQSVGRAQERQEVDCVLFGEPAAVAGEMVARAHHHDRASSCQHGPRALQQELAVEVPPAAFAAVGPGPSHQRAIDGNRLDVGDGQLAGDGEFTAEQRYVSQHLVEDACGPSAVSDVRAALVRLVAHQVREDRPVRLQLLPAEPEPAAAEPAACPAQGYRPAQRRELEIRARPLALIVFGHGIFPAAISCWRSPATITDMPYSKVSSARGLVPPAAVSIDSRPSRNACVVAEASLRLVPAEARRLEHLERVVGHPLVRPP